MRDVIDSSSTDKKIPSIISELINTNQNLLEILGVSHPSLNEICLITKKFGVATKLTGAGGGGCAVSYVQPDCRLTKSQIVSEIEKSPNGFKCFMSSVGGIGVTIIDPLDSN